MDIIKETVEGLPSEFVARPLSTSDVADVMQYAAKNGLAVVPRGSGSKFDWGQPPERADIVLDLSQLSSIVEHAAGDLVVRVRAGTPLSTVVDALAPAGQRLALATRLAGQTGPLGGTVGGLIAANPSGPLRYGYGTVRDLLIGVTMVRADGALAHSGGAVVKNVAGYDLGKLLVGSLGTLGIIIEAVFRLHPVPESFAVVTKTVDTGRQAGELAVKLRHSQVVPTAVEVDRSGSGPATVAVLVEGIAGGIAARADAVAALLGNGVVTEKLPDWWYEPVGGTVLRAAVAASGVGQLMDSAAALGWELSCRGCLGLGVVHFGLSADEPAAIADFLIALRRTAANQHGTIRVESAPRAVHQALADRGTDAWGPVPALDLMRRVKAQFDPDRRLAPGRFVGGI
jgi:glycolate oxidase FAD binding subunit